MLLFPTTANEAIMFLPVMAVLHRRIAQNLQRGAAGAFLVGRSLDTGCGPGVRYRHEEQLSRQTPSCDEGKE